MSKSLRWLRHRVRQIPGAIAYVRRLRDWSRAATEAIRDLGALVGVAWSRLVKGRAPAEGPLRVFMLDDKLPNPTFGAGFPRAAEILKSLLKMGCRVDFYPMEANCADLEEMSRMFGLGVTWHLPLGLRGLRRLLWMKASDIDVLFVSRPNPMQALLDTGWDRSPSSIRLIYDAEAVFSAREARRRELFGSVWSEDEYLAATELEIGLMRNADLITAVSQNDADFIKSAISTPVLRLTHPVEVDPTGAPFGTRNDLLFVGRMTGSPEMSPNVDSMVWFINHVMPELDSMIGSDWKLRLVGILRSELIERLLSYRVIHHGVVDDLRPLYESCRLFVAPTRFAAGIPLKVVEAMGHGLPCVATPLLVDQLGATPEELPSGAGCLQFAEKCRELYVNPGVWDRTRNAGLAYVRRAGSLTAFEHALAQAVQCTVMQT